jgi:hypothetical protein
MPENTTKKCISVHLDVLVGPLHPDSYAYQGNSRDKNTRTNEALFGYNVGDTVLAIIVVPNKNPSSQKHTECHLMKSSFGLRQSKIVSRKNQT